MKRLLFAILMLCSCGSIFGAQTGVRLILSAESARPGDTIWAGIDMKMPPLWHTYWRNGGDSGSPTKIEWMLPDGVKAGELQWPIPEKLVTTIGDVTLITYVYTDEVVLLTPVQLGKDLPSGPITLSAKVSWQECADVCVMGHGQFTAPLTIGATSKPSSDAGTIDAWLKKLPQTNAALSATAYWQDAQTTNDTRAVNIEWDSNAKPADFFPYSGTNYDVQTATEQLPGDKIHLRKMVQKTEGDWPAVLTGVLVGNAGSPDQSGVEVSLPITNNAAEIVVVPAASSGPPPSLVLMILSAFLGGLILNVMPCVLPVIALKILGFVNQSKETPQRVRKLGLVYGGGVLVSFLILAALAIIAQHAGGLAGWGSTFRNPQFRVVITVLITLVALNLFGVFEVTLSGQAMGAAGQLASKQGFAGAFFNGVLATVLATPCTAPFLGIALGFAFSQPPVVTLIIFIMAGLGLALPFVILCWWPQLLKFLPRPGAWMENFKVAMGFPMLATAVWLFWVTAPRLGADGVLWLGLFLVGLALAAWIWGQFVQRGRKRRAVAMVIAMLVLFLDYGYILEGQLAWRAPLGQAKEQIDWKPWSAEAVETARAEGHPVLVDFTADTCLNCKFNKKTSIEIDATRAKLKAINAVCFVADYTDENPAIGKELQRYGRGGVPLVLVFPKDPGRPAIVLPTVLTPSIVLDALDKASK